MPWGLLSSAMGSVQACEKMQEPLRDREEPIRYWRKIKGTKSFTDRL